MGDDDLVSAVASAVERVKKAVPKYPINILMDGVLYKQESKDSKPTPLETRAESINPQD